MKKLRRFILLATVALVLSPRCVTPALAQENAALERLERLEKRVNEIAERQEQLMRRLSAQMERQGPSGQPGTDNGRQPMPPQNAPTAPQPSHAAKVAKSFHDTLGMLFFIGIICNILMTIWIFSDIRRRGEGSGLFVAMALVAGIPAAIIYALTRIGDRRIEAVVKTAP